MQDKIIYFKKSLLNEVNLRKENHMKFKDRVAKQREIIRSHPEEYRAIHFSGINFDIMQPSKLNLLAEYYETDTDTILSAIIDEFFNNEQFMEKETVSFELGLYEKIKSISGKSGKSIDSFIQSAVMEKLKKPLN